MMNRLFFRLITWYGHSQDCFNGFLTPSIRKRQFYTSRRLSSCTRLLYSRGGIALIFCIVCSRRIKKRFRSGGIFVSGSTSWSVNVRVLPLTTSGDVQPVFLWKLNGFPALRVVVHHSILIYQFVQTESFPNGGAFFWPDHYLPDGTLLFWCTSIPEVR